MNQLTEKEIELLHELGKNPSISQRALADRIRISLGMVNLFLRKLGQKGLVKVRKINKRNLQYILTPEGFAERAHHNLHYLENNIQYFVNVKSAINEKVDELVRGGCRAIFIYGKQEWAEVGFLSVKHYDLIFRGFIGDQPGRFLDHPVFTLDEVLAREPAGGDAVLVFGNGAERANPKIAELAKKMTVFYV